MDQTTQNQAELAGLTDEQVAAQRNQGLDNQVAENGQKSLGTIIRRNLFTWLNFFQFGIGVLIALTGAYINLLYLVVVSFNIISGIVQEWRTQRMTNQLAILSNDKVRTRRNGKTVSLEPEQLVLDDVIELTAGDQISADAIVISGQLFANEALLTGEVDPITKNVGAQVLSGSFVVSGKAYARINRIGKDNFATQLTLRARESKRETSPILQSMQHFNHLASMLMLPLGVILFVQAYFVRGASFNRTILNMATALLGIMPIGVQLLLGVSFIAGAMWLSVKHVLVHDLYALDALSRTDVLCLDKTGTITEGKISVSAVHEVPQPAFPYSLKEVLQNFIGATDDNNSTYKALKEYFGTLNEWDVTGKIPFSSEQKWSAVSFADLGTIITGAPEKFKQTTTNGIATKVLAAQQQGKRLICVGYLAPDAETIDPAQATVLAVITFNDKIRTNVHEVLDYCNAQHINVKIISGDNPFTISTVAAHAGIKNADQLVDMSQITTQHDLEVAAQDNNVFGRVTPNQKQALIKALQDKGHTVTMVGDGVNDVLALRAANCSIAINGGSPAAKQAAQLVLLNDDFGILPALIKEGRRVVNIVTRVSSLFFVKVIYSLLLSLVCVVLNVPYPFLPIEITLTDTLIEGYPTFFLQFSQDTNPVKKQPLRFAFGQALPFAIAITLGVGGLLSLSHALPLAANQRTTLMFYLVIWCSLFSLLRICNPYNRLKVLLGIVSVVTVFTAAFVFQSLLGFGPLTLLQDLTLVGIAFGISLALSLLVKGCLMLISRQRA
ncbi:cation-transporting ATPase E [Lactobacillus selangorensis]|uniref:Cation-transporting ATPase E n=1 Tax=Lactobacillus selangorensis TaxID=81857 RepID=A0A0R2FHU2_9LACO|nr:HAD-IC family P-type ATPase [Lactobacillus selangorensis]KRN28112.1 cation-transporting ATPase E [Lactobacillus selangorensis]KRN31011.1 cation-transporting ATPase E [Lactobacillus selangorensis]